LFISRQYAAIIAIDAFIRCRHLLHSIRFQTRAAITDAAHATPLRRHFRHDYFRHFLSRRR
jgi:hypothetical protein